MIYICMYGKKFYPSMYVQRFIEFTEYNIHSFIYNNCVYYFDLNLYSSLLLVVVFLFAFTFHLHTVLMISHSPY